MSPVKLWLVAARPRTLPAAVSPVLVGTSLAIGEGTFRPVAFICALIGSEFGYAGPTREEAIRLTPRRVHIGGDGFTLCGKENVAKSRLTQDWTKVDCKACKKKRQQAGEKQKELFG